MSLAERILHGDRLSLARLLTLIENEDPQGISALGDLYAHTGSAHVVGITGAPGTGKSTLVNRLALALRQGEGNTTSDPQVAIIAVDPSSPFSGGAILGDRIRMRDLSGDPGIFIRSMASRGALGGLARTTHSVAQALDAAGFHWVLIETVGAGQAEVDIASTAHTTIVVDAPGRGDDIQANKAGILEIADILVVNKADLPGADNTRRILELALHMATPLGDGASKDPGDHHWSPPVIATIATQGDGIPELKAAILEHQRFLQRSGQGDVRERARVEHHLGVLLREKLLARFLAEGSADQFRAMVEDVLRRDQSPFEAIDRLLDEASNS
jgi:LAO/AO transport system kinase